MLHNSAMSAYRIRKFKGGISDQEDQGQPGAFKMGRNLDIRKKTDSLSCKGRQSVHP